MRTDVITHYDLLIAEENDPFRDPKPLQDYMNLWDGPAFLEAMALDGSQSVLEIGVGTGRLAARVLPLCQAFTGVDISPATVARAKENLASFPHCRLLCADILSFCPEETYDVVYSSLTLLHIENKPAFFRKAASLLASGGKLVLSISKDQSACLDMGVRQLPLYPDRPDTTCRFLLDAGFAIERREETEFAHLFICRKM